MCSLVVDRRDETTSVLFEMLSGRACETTTLLLLLAPGLARLLPGSGTARLGTDLGLIDHDLAMTMADSILLVFSNFSFGVLRKKSTCAALASDAPIAKTAATVGKRFLFIMCSLVVDRRDEFGFPPWL